MTERKFVNRKQEMKILNDTFRERGFRAVLIYGRRRIGKTYLIKEFLKGKKGVYLLSLKRKIRENIDNFAKISASGGLPYVHAENLIEFFERLSDYMNETVLVIDEFQYLTEKDDAVLSDMQFVFDEILANKNIMIILCGSSVGMVERMGSDLSSPLYGRFSGRIKVRKMRFAEVLEFHPKKSFEEIMRIYGAVDGVPLYHEYFQKGSFDEGVRRNLFNQGSFLYNEAEFLLREELRDSSTYMSILHSLASGRTKITEIANSIYMNAKDLPKYLNVLQNLELVEKVSPVDAKPREKRSVYKISDRYFRFWFTFVEPFKTQIEYGEIEAAVQHLWDNLQGYMGEIAEEIVMEYLRKSYPIVGRWWHKQHEIDVVAVNKKEVLFSEVKWRNRRIGYREYEELKKKSEALRGYEKLEKRYLMVSKSGFRDVDRLIQEGVEMWDAKKLEKMVSACGSYSV